MTNAEKYTKEIIDIVKQGSFIALKNKIPCACHGMSCRYCDFNENDELCEEQRIKWLNAEYEEPGGRIIHAKWKKGRFNNGYIGYDYWYCDNCSYDTHLTYKPTFNYCPDCGAKMDLK